MLAAAAVVLLGLLAMRATFLGTVRAGDLSERRAEHSRFPYELPAERGAIRSGDGADLAIDRLAVDVTASPNLVTDPRGVAAQLAPILKRDPNTLANTLSERGVYAVLARNVAPSAADRARDLGIPGIYFSDTYQRFLPGGPQAAQVLGLTGDEHEGLSGLEKQLDGELTGVSGRRVEVRDLFGRPIQVLSDREPTPGTDVRLEMDSRIQSEVERTLVETRARFGARSAMAIVMRPQDGAILAMSTVPRFNPNQRREINPDLERNRPVTDTFEPGSTFKIVTMTAALEDGKVTPRTAFDLPTSVTKYEGTPSEYTLVDDHRDVPERMTASEILARSSNIGTYTIGTLVGEDRLKAWITRFGFGSVTGIDYPGEVAGNVQQDWSGTSELNIPIGYGTAVTLTQLARAYAAVANGGTLVTPHLVSTVGGKKVTPPARRIMREPTARSLSRMLRGVVDPQGTGSLAEVKGFQVAGKTGTAKKFDATTGEYSDHLYTASFVGYAPADNPQLLVAVVVDEPTGSYYGGDVAAPAFERIAEFSLQTLRITP
jgi:cell division protein FtsI/penicillin-binding protein 2